MNFMKMKALRWYGIRDVRVEEIEKPVPAEGEALIRVLYAGICGSDLHIYNKGMFIQNVPETMGHEFCGIVEQAASPAKVGDRGESASKEAGAGEVERAGTGPADVLDAPCGSLQKGFRKGDLVIANPMVPCGHCESCRRGDYNTCEGLGFIGEVRPGCFAPYICLPEASLIRVPAGADMEKMALAEPLAVAINVCKRAGLGPADSLAIIGAGPIGLLVAAVARQVCGIGEVTVVNRSEPRRRIAERLGARALAALPEGARFDKVVEAAGSPAALRLALAHVRANGQVLPVSVFEEDCTIDANLLVGGQLTITGCNCYGAEELREAVDLLAAGRVDVAPIITDVLPLEAGKAAFEKLCAKDKAAAKILFRLGDTILQ